MAPPWSEAPVSYSTYFYVQNICSHVINLMTVDDHLFLLLLFSPLQDVGRHAASGATGSFWVHQREERDLVEAAFKGLAGLEELKGLAVPDV